MCRPEGVGDGGNNLFPEFPQHGLKFSCQFSEAFLRTQGSKLEG